MPRNVNTTIYKFSELDERAKERARDWYRQGIDYDWGSDNVASLKGWADWFYVKIKNYSLGGSDNRSQDVDFELNIDSNIEELRGVRLWKWMQNQMVLPDLTGNCPFTGYCFDENLLDKIREFINHPWDTDYRELMQDCIDEFCKAYADDVDYQYSDEAVDESMEANDYEFDEDGNRF
jgi:hypothetical protein